MASFTGLKNVGEDVLEYMMKHRPWPDEEMSAGLHDLDNVFPGIYGRHASDYKTFADDPRIDAQSLKVINAVRGNPEAMVDIYRAVPKGVRDFNTGDWISISKNYAKQHGESALNGDYDLIKAKARAADISEPGDSIAEQGYWGNPVIGKVTRGILPLFAAGGAYAAMSPEEASASVPADQYRWPADELGYVNSEPGLGTPLVDVADLATAPIGAATAAGRAASVAAEPFLAYGMDKAVNWAGDKVNGLLSYFGWGE